MYDMMRILVGESLRGSNVLFDERELTLALEIRGFQPDEVYEALSWVQQIHGEGRDYNERIFDSSRGKSLRVMHPEERLAFTPAAHGLIHKLYTSGAVDDVLREEIIQRCIDLATDEIGLEEVKTITLLILLKDRREVLSDRVMEILDIEKSRPAN